jgi:hypothetical protein
LSLDQTPLVRPLSQPYLLGSLDTTGLLSARLLAALGEV